ncbi:MAG: hypothetical protein WC421_09435 [Elusimicrobiales bacterium]
MTRLAKRLAFAVLFAAALAAIGHVFAHSCGDGEGGSDGCAVCMTLSSASLDAAPHVEKPQTAPAEAVPQTAAVFFSRTLPYFGRAPPYYTPVAA